MTDSVSPVTSNPVVKDGTKVEVVVDDSPDTTDGTIEIAPETPAVTGTSGYIVWNTQSYVVCAGPFLDEADAQDWINHTELRDSRADGYLGTVYSIGTVVL